MSPAALAQPPASRPSPVTPRRVHFRDSSPQTRRSAPAVPATASDLKQVHPERKRLIVESKKITPTIKTASVLSSAGPTPPDHANPAPPMFMAVKLPTISGPPTSQELEVDTGCGATSIGEARLERLLKAGVPVRLLSNAPSPEMKCAFGTGTRPTACAVIPLRLTSGDHKLSAAVHVGAHVVEPMGDAWLLGRDHTHRDGRLPAVIDEPAGVVRFPSLGAVTPFVPAPPASVLSSIKINRLTPSIRRVGAELEDLVDHCTPTPLPRPDAIASHA